MQQIILNFPPGMAGEARTKLSQSVNKKLDPIKNEINSWNGFIDLKKVTDDNYQFIAICDNEDTRAKMQHLLMTCSNKME